MGHRENRKDTSIWAIGIFLFIFWSHIFTAAISLFGSSSGKVSPEYSSWMIYILPILLVLVFFTLNMERISYLHFGKRPYLFLLTGLSLILYSAFIEQYKYISLINGSLFLRTGLFTTLLYVFYFVLVRHLRKEFSKTELLIVYICIFSTNIALLLMEDLFFSIIFSSAMFISVYFLRTKKEAIVLGSISLCIIAGFVFSNPSIRDIIISHYGAETLSYQTEQSIKCIRSGGFFGIHKSELIRENRLDIKKELEKIGAPIDLPDFSNGNIAAVAGLETGFLGIVLSVLLVLFLVNECLNTISLAQSKESGVIMLVLLFIFVIWVLTGMGTAAGLFPSNGEGLPTISNRIGNIIFFWLLIVVTIRFVNQGKSSVNPLNLNIKVTMLTISSLFLIIIVRYLWVII